MRGARTGPFLACNLRPVIIISGLLSSVAGTLGSFLLLEKPGGGARRLAGAVHEIDKLGALTGVNV